MSKNNKKVNFNQGLKLFSRRGRIQNTKHLEVVCQLLTSLL